MEHHNHKKFDWKLGDLIAAAGEVAFEYSDSDKEGYRLARFALIEIIKNGSFELDIVEKFNGASVPKHDLN
jgi:hypothetical protein